jgi:hypothetical protein
MKAASINELKQELENIPAAQLTLLCLRLARFKKENKELLTYLLFESFDEQAYIINVKKEMDEQFEEVNKTNIYFAKKSFRKILKAVNKYIRFTQSKHAEVELLLHFCSCLKNSGIPLKKNIVLNNLYQTQLKKINKTIATLHEDLQYDYLKEVEKLQI